MKIVPSELMSWRVLFSWARPMSIVLVGLTCSACNGPHAPVDDVDPASLRIGGGVITISIGGGEPPVPAERVRAWIETAARVVSDYYGQFPVKRVEIAVRAEGDGKIADGVTYSGRRIEVRLGANTRRRDVDRDWMMTHEMFHLGFPKLDKQWIWMEEGLSTYLEPLARARAGNLRAEQVWGEFVRVMPQGLPRIGDEGLDRTHTWGRTYWGGAMFWLMADVEIRERTENRRSLDDAIKAILAAGGNGAARWEVGRVLAVADRATGTDAVSRLYDKFAEAPGEPDLQDLWRRLGVEAGRGRVKFNDAAPLAGIRRSMTERADGQTKR